MAARIFQKTPDGKILVMSSVIAYMLNLSQRQISRYVQEGMPQGEKNWFDIRAVHEWLSNEEAKRFEKSIVADIDDDELSEADVDIALKKARTKNLLEDTEIKTLKKEILDGVYVKADELDRNMAELAGVFIASLKDMRATLPKILSDRTEDEVIRIMDDEFERAVVKIERGIFSDDDEFDI